MAKKKDVKSKRARRSYGVKLQWRLNHLSEAKINDADERSPSPNDLLEFLTSAVDAGLDVKVSWDDFSSCYIASAVGAWDGFDSAGYAVSARSGRDCLDALALVWYKVVILADGDLSSIPSDTESDDMRG